MQQNWEILKDLEQQQQRNKLFEPKTIKVGGLTHEMSHESEINFQGTSNGMNGFNHTKPAWSESQVYQLQ